MKNPYKTVFNTFALAAMTFAGITHAFAGKTTSLDGYVTHGINAYNE